MQDENDKNEGILQLRDDDQDEISFAQETDRITTNNFDNTER